MSMMLLSLLYTVNLALGLIGFIQAARGYNLPISDPLKASLCLGDRDEGSTKYRDSPSSRVEPRALSTLGAASPGRELRALPGVFSQK